MLVVKNIRKIAWFGLVTALALSAISAYLRIQQAGIGCSAYPECYARIGASYEFPELIVVLHFLVTAFLGLAMLALNIAALRAKQHRVLSLAALVLTVLNALLTARFGGMNHPALVMGQLVGQITLIGLLGWLVFRLDLGSPRYMETRIRPLRPLIMTALVFLGLQVVVGGLTSANFAATACKTFPNCNGQWLPDATIYSALKIAHSYDIDPNGYATGGMERASIHQAHRVLGVLALLFIAAAALSGMMTTYAHRKIGAWILFIVSVEFSLGVALVLTELPAALAVAHNLLAAVLLLLLLKLMAISREKWWPG